MAARQRIVVIEDGTLEFDILLQERYVLDLPDLLDKARAVSRYGRYLVHVPDIAGLLNVLVPIDLGLFVSPVRKRSGVRPHSNSGGGVNQFKVSRKAFELLPSLGIFDLDFEQRIVVPLPVRVLEPYCREFLVRGIVRRGNIMRQEVRVRHEMPQFDKVTALYTLAGFCAGEVDDAVRNDLPVIIGIIERVAGYLLSLAGNTSVIVA